MGNTRLECKARWEQLVSRSLDLVAEQGTLRITRLELSDAIGCAPGLISHYFGTMANWRIEVLRAARILERADVLLVAIVAHDEAVRALPARLRLKILDHMEQML